MNLHKRVTESEIERVRVWKRKPKQQQRDNADEKQAQEKKNEN